ALNSLSNDLLFLLAMDHSWRILAPFGVSTKAGDDQTAAVSCVARQVDTPIAAERRGWCARRHTSGRRAHIVRTDATHVAACTSRRTGKVRFATIRRVVVAISPLG